MDYSLASLRSDMAAWRRILVLTATIVSVAILLAIIYTA